MKALQLAIFFIFITSHIFSQEPIFKTEIWYGNKQLFGNAGFPQPMINIIGQVSNHDELHNLSYSFLKSRNPLPIGPTAFRLAEPGEFNIEIDRTILTPGDYNLGLVAMYKNGDIIREELSFRLENKNAPLPFHINWPDVQNIQDVAQVVDGKWEITDTGLRNINIGYDRAVVIGDSSWRDYDLTTEFTLHSVSDNPNTFVYPSMHVAMHIAVRWQGHEDWGDIYPRRGWSGFGALFSYDYKKDAQQKMVWIVDQIEKRSIKKSMPYSIELGLPYILRAQVYSRPGKTSVYKMKLWKKGEPEPAEWELEEEGRPGEPEKGSVLLVSHHADISFRSVKINEVKK